MSEQPAEDRLAHLAELYDVPVAALRPEALERVIGQAVSEHRFDVVPGLLKVYVAVDPHRAGTFYETLQLALGLARQRTSGSVL